MKARENKRECETTFSSKSYFHSNYKFLARSHISDDLDMGTLSVACEAFIQCVPEKRKPINRVNFSENCNDLSEKVYIVTKFSLSSFF